MIWGTVTTSSWPLWCTFHSTCAFIVSSTIKQGQFTVTSFFFPPVARRGFLSLTMEPLLPANNSPHIGYDFICSFAYRMCSWISPTSGFESLCILPLKYLIFFDKQSPVSLHHTWKLWRKMWETVSLKWQLSVFPSGKVWQIRQRKWCAGGFERVSSS